MEREKARLPVEEMSLCLQSDDTHWVSFLLLNMVSLFLVISDQSLHSFSSKSLAAKRLVFLHIDVHLILQ